MASEFRIPDSKIEEIRDAADIVEVVSDYVRLKKSGSSFSGLCPFHNEKTPSFYVTPSMGIYKCFGCGESGDVFQFLMDQGGMSFSEAIYHLADKYGVPMPEPQAVEPDEDYKFKEGVYHALKFAGVQFYKNLMESEHADKALKYLEQRGYNRSVIRKYGLGYSLPDFQSLYDVAQSADIDVEYLLGGDLIKPKKHGEGYYDTFRNRLMFPIFNTSGKVIAFAGRVLGSEKTAKYVNSAQTEVYNKSQVLYGLNFAKNDIRRKKEVILVEGYTDVITLGMHGINNVVASSGTALTPGQIRVLHRYCDRIIMIYDADAAGQKAMKRGIDIALAQDMEVLLLELPDGEDPDSFVRQYGKESFDDEKSKNAQDFVDFLVTKADTEGRLQNPNEIVRIIDEIIETIANIPGEIRRQTYIQYLHQKTHKYRGGSDKELFKILDQILFRKRNEAQRDRNREQRMASNTQINDGLQQNDRSQSDQKERSRQTKAKRPEYEKELIRLMLLYGNDMIEYIGSYISEKMFEDEQIGELFEDIIHKYADGEDINRDIYIGKSEKFRKVVGDVLLDRYSTDLGSPGKDYTIVTAYQSAKGAMKALMLAFYQRYKATLADEFNHTDDDSEKMDIMKEITAVNRKVSEITSKLLDALYPDPDTIKNMGVKERRFEYNLKPRDE